MACEQGDQERIWALVEIISTGKLPDGHTEEDLRAMGLPVPGELYREEQPDGTILIRQHAPSKLEEIEAMKKNTADNKNAFVCDTPIND
ncbi:MAG TPA: hypothetical protein VFC54_13665 [Pseudolabrys sp.]|nr:hypothetical protein [Pseudolabrys sp.]